MLNEELCTKYKEIAKETRARSRHAFSHMFSISSITSLRNLLNRYKTNRTLIPNANCGELELCVNNCEAYYDISLFTDEDGLIDNDFYDKHKINFLKAEINEKFDSVLLQAGTLRGSSRERFNYIEKSLTLLEENGVMLLIININFLNRKACATDWKKIMGQYSISEIYDYVDETKNSNLALLVIENHKQNPFIKMHAYSENSNLVNSRNYSLHNRDIFTENINESLFDENSGFDVPVTELEDRIDPNYYLPSNNEGREMYNDVNAVKLSNIATIFRGAIFGYHERKQSGEYMVITPVNLIKNEVVIRGNESYYSFDDSLDNYSNERAVLIPGDILISSESKGGWAVYNGPYNSAIANSLITIVRAKEEYVNVFRLFFSTEIGIKYFEKQIKLFKGNRLFNFINYDALSNISIPELKMMAVADEIEKGPDIEARLARFFNEIGWEVRDNYSNDKYSFDLALFYRGELKAIVEVKNGVKNQLVKSKALLSELNEYQRNLKDISVLLYIDNELYINDCGVLTRLNGFPRPEAIIERNRRIRKDVQTISSISFSDGVRGYDTEVYDAILEKLAKIENKVEETNRNVKEISKKIDELAKQIVNLKSLTSKVLDVIESDEEKEKIIHAFSEECAKEVLLKMENVRKQNEYEIEQQKLIKTFGLSAWNKMDKRSKQFLISAKVMFYEQNMINPDMDYSGVCLLVTKAMEFELKKRFYTNYLVYLRENYPERRYINEYPISLLDNYGNVMKEKYFTLGSVAYVLGEKRLKNSSDIDNQNNDDKLVEYVHNKLIFNKNKTEILDILYGFASSIETVREEYRNPTAHTNRMTKVNAEECFKLVLDVERLMEKMLDTFEE